MASPKGAQKAVQDALKSLLTESYMRKLGEMAAEMIRLRTRLGYGVDADGSSRTKLKALSPAYKLRRAQMKLNENTSATKSNLTRTGQLLSSLGTKSVSGTTVVVGPKGSRDDGHTNEQVAQWVAEQGRGFNHLSNIERKRLIEQVRKDLQAVLQKALVKLK